MKNYLILPAIAFILTTIIFSEGCKKDTDSLPPGLEEPNISGVMMTMSAISYTADSLSNSVIKDSIGILLSDETLATKGKWDLVWGPGISPHNENLLYVAKYNSGENPAYTIAIRGTNINSIGNILVDLKVFTLVEFPYGMPGDSVGKGPMEGFTNLLTSQDSVIGTTLEDFLKSVTSSEKIPLFITGHSQGGGLAPLMAYWLYTNEALKDKFTISTYAFAGPGWFNKSFKDNFLNNSPADASFSMQVNSLDMIPYGYSNLSGIISGNIPVKVPSPYILAIHFAKSLLTAEGIVYHNIAVADSIGFIPITANSPILDSLEWYNHWLMVEHNHNNYLKLLDVKSLN
jgi:hypothetical protein